MNEILAAAACALGAGLVYTGLLPTDQASGPSALRRTAHEAGRRLGLFLRLAEVPWTPNEFLLVSLTVGVAVGIVVQL